MPKRLLTWPVAMVRAAAIVKPVVTGTDMNRMSTPRLSKPIRVMMQPDRKHISTAYAGLPSTYGCTISAMMAVGPVEERFELLSAWEEHHLTRGSPTHPL